jgi:hypothetical protein
MDCDERYRYNMVRDCKHRQKQKCFLSDTSPKFRHVTVRQHVMYNGLDNRSGSVHA